MFPAKHHTQYLTPSPQGEPGNLIYQIYRAWPETDTFVLTPGEYHLAPMHYFYDHPEPDLLRKGLAENPPKIKLVGEEGTVIKTDKLGLGAPEELTFENIIFEKDPKSKSRDFIELRGWNREAKIKPKYSFKNCHFRFEGRIGNLIWFQEASALDWVDFEECEVGFSGSLYSTGGKLQEVELPLTLPKGLSFPTRIPFQKAIVQPKRSPEDQIPLGTYHIGRLSPGIANSSGSATTLYDRNDDTTLLLPHRAGVKIAIDLQAESFSSLLIVSGFPNQNLSWEAYRRIRYLTLLLDQNPVMQVALLDTRGGQVIELAPIMAQLGKGKRLSLQVTGVYEGKSNSSLAIGGVYGLE